MVGENIMCPMCRERMRKFINKDSIPITTKKVAEKIEPILMPVNYFICIKCHNLQTFVELEYIDPDKLFYPHEIF